MRFVQRAALAAVTALVPVAAWAVTPVTAPQSVTKDELQRFIYEPNYPTWCGDAGQAAREMRVKPTTDPKFLHGVMKANIPNCANTTYAQQHPALWTTAVFGAAAAALLAARHEGPPQALQDATHAKTWSQDLVNFQRTPGYMATGPGSAETPTMYRTNAGRINKDAVALISAIKAHQSSAAAASPDALPEHASAPGASGASHAAASPAAMATP